MTQEEIEKIENQGAVKVMGVVCDTLIDMAANLRSQPCTDVCVHQIADLLTMLSAQWDTITTQFAKETSDESGNPDPS